MLRYDSIIVGGGTAGSILAARLSEERDHNVLLLEAGPDYPEEVPADLLNGNGPVTAGHNWDLEAFVSEDGPSPANEQMGRVARVFEVAASRLGPGAFAGGGGSGARFSYPMGKVVGGGSAINGSLAFHARPQDYAAWSAAGCDAWAWEKVLPYFGRLEGAESEKLPLSIETTPLEGLTRTQGAFLATCGEMGHARVDLRAGTAGGAGVIPMSSRNGERVSTAKLYLQSARRRPNLTIRSCCLVDRLLFDEGTGGLTATGVEALVDGQRCRFSGGQIILAAGAIHSPVILLRSGIGAPREVARLGARPLLDLSGVGKNLMEHPAVSIWGVPKAGACLPGEPVHQVMLQQRSGTAGELCDVQIYMLSAVPTWKLPPLQDVVGSDIAIGVSVLLATPVSKGRIELLDGDPRRSPRIYLNCLRETSDLSRMKEGLRSAWRILQGERLKAETERLVMWNQGVADSDHLLEKVIRATARGGWHPAGTLRMGREGDPMAVVDQHGRLFGCRNVIVADGSIMPALPSVPTNLTCMLIAEKIAAHLRGLDDVQRSRDE